MQYLKMTLTSDATVSDSPPKQVNVGAINPYALVEVILGRPIDRESAVSAHTLSTVLQADYDELFDMKHDSVIYAGLKLNPKTNAAERLTRQDMHTLTEDDMATPDMSKIRKINDLKDVGLEDIGETPVKLAWMQNGKLRLVLQPQKLGRTLSSNTVTESLRETATPFRKEKGAWTPPNSTWESASDLFRRLQQFRGVRGIQGGIHQGHFLGSGQHIPSAFGHQEYDNPVQGTVANSWLIAALFAVAWSDPFNINRDNQVSKGSEKQKDRTFSVKLYSKGGENDAPTSMTEVNYDIPINNSTNAPLYCQSSGGMSIVWPSMYEKAFAKWLTRSSSDHPDVTQLSASAMGGDPVKAMAQITDGNPHYFFTQSRSGADLLGLVRANTINFKTIRPMVAFTHASGRVYKGTNMVANHAYTVLGWAFPGGSKEYIIVRNPWGVTEPKGLTSYPGLLDAIDADFWPPAQLVDRRGVLALEASAFQEYFACLGMAK